MHLMGMLEKHSEDLMQQVGGVKRTRWARYRLKLSARVRKYRSILWRSSWFALTLPTTNAFWPIRRYA